MIRISAEPIIIITVPTSFFKIFFSLKYLYPKNKVTNDDNWNNAKAKPTSIYLKTKFVDNCLILRHTDISNRKLKSDFLTNKLLLENISIKNANKNPLNAHNINEIWNDDIIIIFFKIAASIPVKISAMNPKRISFLKKTLRVNFS